MTTSCGGTSKLKYGLLENSITKGLIGNNLSEK